MDPDPGGGRAEGGRGSRERQRGRRKGEGRHAVLRLLFLEEGDKGALASAPPLLSLGDVMMDPDLE